MLGVTAVGTAGTPSLLPTRDNTTLVQLATIEVTVPSAALSPARLPMQHAITPPANIADLALLGYSGDTTIPLAGTALDISLFWQKRPTGAQSQQFYISLLNQQGDGVAGWSGWPLPAYPTEQWVDGALVQTPVTVVLPPTLTSGDYQLGAGLIDPVSGEKSPFVLLGRQQVQQREATFIPQTPPQPLPQPAQFGTHAQLQGYALTVAGESITLQLYWQILQTLWPPHHIFVHLDTAAGQTIAQADGVPQSKKGPAPTGSWLPGEYLVTTHQLTTSDLSPDLHLSVGLYLPSTGERLPVSIAGQGAGDAVIINQD